MEQLCWTCKKACGGCSWSEYKRFELPEGAVVKTKTKNVQKWIHGIVMDCTEHITAIVYCPEYEKDSGVRKEKMTE